MPRSSSSSARRVRSSRRRVARRVTTTCCESYVSAVETRCVECAVKRAGEVRDVCRAVHASRADDVAFFTRVDASSSDFWGENAGVLVKAVAANSSAPALRWVFEESSRKAEAEAYVRGHGSTVLRISCVLYDRKRDDDVERFKYLFERLGLRKLFNDVCFEILIGLEFSLPNAERKDVVKRQCAVLTYLHEEQDFEFDQHHLCMASKHNDCVEAIEYMYNNGAAPVPECALRHAFKFLNVKSATFYIEKCGCDVNLRQQYMLLNELWKDDDMFEEYAKRVYSGSHRDYLEFGFEEVRDVVSVKIVSMMAAIRDMLKTEDERESLVVRELMSLVDEHKQNFTESKYLDICAFLKKKHDILHASEALPWTQI